MARSRTRNYRSILKNPKGLLVYFVLMLVVAWISQLSDQGGMEARHTTRLQPPVSPIQDFRAAKRVAHTLYADNPNTFYCGCPYSNEGVDLNSCDYVTRKDEMRANRLEWEHVVPASLYGQGRPCWSQGGRKHCTRNDPDFRAMEADLHNLVPAIGEINNDRSNFHFGVVRVREAQYGACDFKVDFSRRLVEPRQAVRGDIARIYFYMMDTYQVAVSKEKYDMLLQWHQEDPVDAWELERDFRIEAAQGNHNPYVRAPQHALRAP